MSLELLKSKYGLVFETSDPVKMLAMDAQANLTTIANAGIPQQFTNFVDPRFIETVLKIGRAHV